MRKIVKAIINYLGGYESTRSTPDAELIFGILTFCIIGGGGIALCVANQPQGVLTIKDTEECHWTPLHEYSEEVTPEGYETISIWLQTYPELKPKVEVYYQDKIITQTEMHRLDTTRKQIKLRKEKLAERQKLDDAKRMLEGTIYDTIDMDNF